MSVHKLLLFAIMMVFTSTMIMLTFMAMTYRILFIILLPCYIAYALMWITTICKNKND